MKCHVYTAGTLTCRVSPSQVLYPFAIPLHHTSECGGSSMLFSSLVAPESGTPLSRCVGMRSYDACLWDLTLSELRPMVFFISRNSIHF
jgi:hypothetical protein